MPEVQIRYYLLQLVSVIEYLHDVKKVIHRDLKLENILLDAHNNVKVVDFGLSRRFSDDDQQFTTPCGSPPYLAPELISTGTYTRATDIWSLGIVLYALAIGSLPFCHNDFQTLCREILSKRIRYPITLSDDLIDLLKRMLCRNPEERITIDQIKQHRWFPGEQYATVVEATKSMMQFGDENCFGEIDEDTVDVMISNGIDCTGLSEALAAGEENEMTVLYNVYLRQKQAEQMNQILRVSKLRVSASQGPGSLPPRLSGLPPVRPPSSTAQTTDRPIPIAKVPPVDWAARPAIVATPRSRRTPVMAVRRGLMIHVMRPIGEVLTAVQAVK
jgi:serine/threonine protein kinase